MTTWVVNNPTPTETLDEVISYLQTIRETRPGNSSVTFGVSIGGKIKKITLKEQDPKNDSSRRT